MPRYETLVASHSGALHALFNIGLRLMPRYETLVSCHSGALEHEFGHAFYT